MRTLTSLLLSAVLWLLPSSGARVAGLPSAPAPLSVGDPAPPFNLPGSDGRVYKLSDFRGKQVVVLAWFAKAFTGG